MARIKTEMAGPTIRLASCPEAGGRHHRYNVAPRKGLAREDVVAVSFGGAAPVRADSAQIGRPSTRNSLTRHKNTSQGSQAFVTSRFKTSMDTQSNSS